MPISNKYRTFAPELEWWCPVTPHQATVAEIIHIAPVQIMLTLEVWSIFNVNYPFIDNLRLIFYDSLRLQQKTINFVHTQKIQNRVSHTTI